VAGASGQACDVARAVLTAEARVVRALPGAVVVVALASHVARRLRAREVARRSEATVAPAVGARAFARRVFALAVHVARARPASETARAAEGALAISVGADAAAGGALVARDAARRAGAREVALASGLARACLVRAVALGARESRITHRRRRRKSGPRASVGAPIATPGCAAVAIAIAVAVAVAVAVASRGCRSDAGRRSAVGDRVEHVGRSRSATRDEDREPGTQAPSRRGRTLWGSHSCFSKIRASAESTQPRAPDGRWDGGMEATDG
jgi:hypothetical protein